MHADTIEEHQLLAQIANGLADAWRGTDPMHSEAEVDRALAATMSEGSDTSALLPYVVDACRERGLLVSGGPIAIKFTAAAQVNIDRF